MTLGRRPRPASERFLDKVSPEPNSGCWLWTGAIDRDGYGKFGLMGEASMGAHRAAYQLFVGDVPADLTIDHLLKGSSMTRDKERAQLHDRQDDLVRELEETNRELARTVDLVRKALAVVEHAKGVLAQVLGEAVGRPRVAPPSPSAEQIQDDFVERRGGR